jgi:hypothetical protein
MIVKMIQYLQDRLKRVTQACGVFLVLLVVFDAVLLDKEKAHTSAENMPGFWALFGFISCVVIIFVSKWFGKAGITRQEDYYDR